MVVSPRDLALGGPNGPGTLRSWRHSSTSDFLGREETWNFGGPNGPGTLRSFLFIVGHPLGCTLHHRESCTSMNTDG